MATPRVHARGEARLDAMLELVEEASRSAPLSDVLAGMARRIAALLGVEVTSVYLREPGSDELVMRATHGYPAEAVGQVRLAIGEGLTGFCVECLRPVSVARATFDARNRSFPGLDEERFPSLCAVPLVDGGRAVGALVVQRQQPRAFGEREVVLIASLCSPVLLAVERARTRRAERALDDGPRTGRPLDVMLQGAGVAPGEGLGVARVRRDVELKSVSGSTETADERRRLASAVAAVTADVAELEAWAQENVSGLESRARLRSLLLSSRGVLDDMLLQERMRDGIGRSTSRGLVSADGSVAETMQTYTRSLLALGDPMLVDRAVEMEALCLRIRARLAGPPERLPSGRVWCAGRLPVCDALSLARSQAAGVVLTEPIVDGDGPTSGMRVAAALGMPVVVGVTELFRWVVDGDRLLVDGDSGRVIINPGRPEVAALRQRRRDRR